MTNPDFTHFVITRFNIRVSGSGPEKMNTPYMDVTFLNQRIDLFQKYCAPSIHQQTDKNFTWILYFDTETDHALLDRVRKISSGSIPVIFAMVNQYDDMLQDIKQRMKHSTQPYCIMTRLDNDDILSSDYIATVQQLFVKQHHTLINFTQGYEVDITHHLIKKWTTRHKNQFTSLIEERQSPELLTIYSFSHVTVPEAIHIINYEHGAKWAYTRHELNYSPQKINVRPIFFKSALHAFPSLKEKVHISFIYTIKYTWLWLKKTSKRRMMRYFGIRK